MRRSHSVVGLGVIVLICLVIGALTNVGVAVWNVRRHHAADLAAEAKLKGTMWEFGGWRRYGQSPLSKTDVAQSPPPPRMPHEWPLDGWSRTDEEFGSLRKQFFVHLEDKPETHTVSNALLDEVGWPCRCFWRATFMKSVYLKNGSRSQDSALEDTGELYLSPWWSSWLGVRSLPSNVHVLALAANTVTYAMAPLGLWLLVVALVRWRRHREGVCVGCGYDLSGLQTGGRCPECGRNPRTLAPARGILDARERSKE